MKRALLILAIILGVVFLSPSSAFAGCTGCDSVIDDSSNFSSIENLVETGDDAAFATDSASLYQAAGGAGGTYDATAAREVVAGITAAGDTAEVATGTLSAAELIPAVGAVVTAGYVGWQIGGAIDHWMGWNQHGATLSSTSDYTGGMWIAVRCTGLLSVGKASGGSFTYANGAGAWYSGGSTPTLYNQCGAASVTLGRSVPFNIWIYNAQRSGSCTGAQIDNISSCQWDNGFSCTSTCDLSGDGQNFRLYTALTSVMGQLALQPLTTGFFTIPGAYLTLDAGCPGGAQYWAQPGTTNTTTSSNCQGSLWRTSEQMLADHSMKSKVLTSDPCGGCVSSAGSTIGSLKTSPPSNIVSHASCTYSSTCGVAIRTQIKTHVITERWIVHELDPTVVPNDPAVAADFTFPKPNVNETYTDYISRLRTLGWVGVATSTLEPSALSGYGPNAITRLQYTGNDTTLHTLDPLLWPTSVPLAQNTASITVRYNPSTATPIGTDTSSSTCGTTDNPCVVTDPSTGDGGTCDTCAIDWTPIEDLSVGTKFPFGLPAWIEGFFGGLTFSDSCTQSLDLNADNPSGSPTINIPFCNAAWEDTYRPIVFPILEALLTLAAVVFMATKVLGYGGGE